MAADPTVDGDALILEAVVNGVPKGDCVAMIVEGRIEPVWIDAECVARWGVSADAWPGAEHDGRRFLRLAPTADLALSVDLETLRLKADFAPQAFATQRIDLDQSARDPLAGNAGFNGFIDYSLAAHWVSGGGSGLAATLDATASAGAWVVHSEHSLEAGVAGFQHLRRRSFASYEWPQAMTRLLVGDVEAGGAALSQLGPLGGVRIERAFETRPGFLPTPAFEYAGAAAGAGKVEVYVDGVRVRTAELAPGPYELRNLRYFAGSRRVDLVVTDAFGRRSTTTVPFYFSSGNLARGVDEFSYSFGRQRTGAGPRTDYGEAGLSGRHRVGLTDSLTLGASVDWFASYRQFGLEAAVRLGRWGTLDASVARSRRADGASGNAVTGVYAYVGDGLSLSASYYRQDADFGLPLSPVGELAPYRVRSQATAGLAFALGPRQTVGVQLARGTAFDAPGSRSASLRYGLRAGRASLSAQVGQRQEGEARGLDASLSLSIELGRSTQGSLQLEAPAGAGLRQRLTAERSSPPDGGWTGRAGIEHGDGDLRLEASWRQPTALGDWSASARVDRSAAAGTGGGVEVRFAGAIAAIDGALFASRPIYQGFAMVDTGGLPGVRVYQNNQLAGRTRKDGRLLVPAVATYTRSQLRLDDRDIPLDIALQDVSASVVPRAYAGAVVRFAARRIAAAAGRLEAVAGDRAQPVRAAVLLTTVGGAAVETSTGPDGDFYLENLLPGDYLLSARNNSVECTARFSLVEPMQSFTELGTLPCVAGQGAAP